MNIEHSKRILLVAHEMTYSGAPRSLLNIAILLNKHNIYVEVWSLHNGSFIKEYKDAGINTKIINEDIDRYSVEIRKYDVVILNTIFTAHLEPMFKKYARTILYIREAQNIPIIARNCFLDEENIRNANEIVCVSEYAESFIREKYAPKNVKVVHNFVEDTYKGNINLVKENMVHFMVSGTYEERKGQDIVIEAFKKLPDELKEISKLHIVGRKPEWSKSFWEPLKKKYDNRIIEHEEIKNRHELLDLYNKMNVFIIASRDESCSLVALEGAMLGKAVIMSENTGAKYLDKSAKYIYSTLNSDELCRKMSQLTSRKELILRGMNMRRMYKKTSTEKVFEKNFLRLILEE